MCGNYDHVVSAIHDCLGSPPRVRELLAPFLSFTSPRRITPACAGITSFTRESIDGVEDHPRVCGNYIDSFYSCAFKPGSPPRVRELLFRRLHSSARYRITPACAGITTAEAKDEKKGQDHPRVCGNYVNAWDLVRLHKGSPPRVRELQTKVAPTKTYERITPACAGITGHGSHGQTEHQDHPRVCGNYIKGSLILSRSSFRFLRFSFTFLLKCVHKLFDFTCQRADAFRVFQGSMRYLALHTICL